MRLPSLMRRTVLSNRAFLLRAIRTLMVSLQINVKAHDPRRASLACAENNGNTTINQSMSWWDTGLFIGGANRRGRIQEKQALLGYKTRVFATSLSPT